MLDDPRMTEEEQIKKQRHLEETGYEGTLITPGIVSRPACTQVATALMTASLQLYVRQDVYGIAFL